MLMDEPFSAVDPVVREQLQNEFLRLQSELGKTIAFVTHDIDEAIKLGDKVAVMRVGGKLAQFAEPAELLSHPADAFVAGFVGRDRGYRALGFAAAGELPTAEEDVVRLGAQVRQARDDAQDGWTLVVDDDDQPQGWLASRRADRARRSTARSPPTCSTSAARWPSSRARCAKRSTPRCPRPADAASSSTATAGSSARSPPARCSSASSRAPQPSVATPSTPLVGVAPVGELWTYFTDHRSDIMSWLWTTVWLAGVPLLIGLALALPIGWVASRYRWTYPPITSLAGLLYTIPSLVLFLALPGILGTGILSPINVAVGLTFYTVALLVRTVADGLDSVSPTRDGGGLGDGLHRSAALLRRPTAARRAGDRRRAAGRRGVERQPRVRRRRSSA